MVRSFRPEPLVVGVALIALGVAWMLANAGRLDLLSALRTWWPATLIVWGVLELVAYAAHRRARRS